MNLGTFGIRCRTHCCGMRSSRVGAHVVIHAAVTNACNMLNCARSYTSLAHRICYVAVYVCVRTSMYFHVQCSFTRNVREHL